MLFARCAFAPIEIKAIGFPSADTCSLFTISYESEASTEEIKLFILHYSL
jgi:hypothetical protein